jgi:hypothetical protein
LFGEGELEGAMTQTEFDNWFAEPLALLNTQPHGAFAVLMLALPLTERYLREKSGCREGDLDDRFYTEFVKLFPTVANDLAKKFWHCYRNGLLHQATFSRQNRKGVIMPQAWISSRLPITPAIINYDPANDVFVLLPKEFSEEIVRVIRADFHAFLGSGSPNHPPAKVEYPLSWPERVKKPGSTDYGPPPSGIY